MPREIDACFWSAGQRVAPPGGTRQAGESGQTGRFETGYDRLPLSAVAPLRRFVTGFGSACTANLGYDATMSFDVVGAGYLTPGSTAPVIRLTLGPGRFSRIPGLTVRA